jgi:hypothetical protein
MRTTTTDCIEMLYRLTPDSLTQMAMIGNGRIKSETASIDWQGNKKHRCELGDVHHTVVWALMKKYGIDAPFSKEEFITEIVKASGKESESKNYIRELLKQKLLCEC